MTLSIIGGINDDVKVEASEGNIICTFLKQELGEKSCSVIYGPSCEQLSSEQLAGQIDDGNIVVIPLLENTNRYCYNVTAVTSTAIVVRVTGYFETGKNGNTITFILNMHINFI